MKKQKPIFNSRSSIDIEQLWKDYKNAQASGDGNIYRNQLVEFYLPLVKYNAKKIYKKLPEHMELDDLISTGVFGLINAIKFFDLSRGIKFENYCIPRIRGSIIDELRATDFISRRTRESISVYKKTKENLESKTAGPVTCEEVFEELKKTSGEKYAKKILAHKSQFASLISLDKALYETNSYKNIIEADRVPDSKSENPLEKIEKDDFLKTTAKKLNRDEKLVLFLYYYRYLTMKEIAATLNLSKTRISQLHSQLIAGFQRQERKQERMCA